MSIKVQQAGTCLLSIAVDWRYGFSLDGSEFSGGRLTSRLLDMNDAGLLLFTLALLLIYFHRQTAAALTLVACVLCVPLYVYFMAPGLFRQAFGKFEWSVPLKANFMWDNRAMIGIAVLLVAAFVAIRVLLSSPDSKARDFA